MLKLSELDKNKAIFSDGFVKINMVKKITSLGSGPTLGFEKVHQVARAMENWWLFKEIPSLKNGVNGTISNSTTPQKTKAIIIPFGKNKPLMTSPIMDLGSD